MEEKPASHSVPILIHNWTNNHQNLQALLKFRALIQPQRQVHHPEMQANKKREGADKLNCLFVSTEA